MPDRSTCKSVLVPTRVTEDEFDPLALCTCGVDLCPSLFCTHYHFIVAHTSKLSSCCLEKRESN